MRGVVALANTPACMSLQVASLIALVAASLLALGFHRHRAAQIGVLLTILALAMDSGSMRWEQGAARFLPLLALFSVGLPEGRLWSRRHALWLGALLLLTGVTLDAPERLFHSMADFAAGPLVGLGWRTSAGWVLGVAALGALLRYLHARQISDLGSAFALTAAATGSAIAFQASAWFLLAGVCMLVSLLAGNYRMAFRDPLTGIPNRRALDETLSRLSGDYRLAMLDIDHFKQFNDTHGHDAGDQVLREVARQLARHADGRVFRYGGEEFCVIYPGGDDRRAAAGLERARAAIEEHEIEVATKPSAKSAKAASGAKPNPTARAKRPVVRPRVKVTISAGCAARQPQRKQANEVLKVADQALYRAKKKGRNRVVMA